MADIVLNPPAMTRGSPASTRPVVADSDLASAGACLSPRVALWSIVGFWVFYFVLNTLRVAIVDADGQIGMLGRRLIVSAIGMVLTGLLCLFLRQLEGKSTRTLVSLAFLASLPVSFAYATINYLAFYVVQPLDSIQQEIAKHPDEQMQPIHAIADSALTWYFFIAAWAVLYVALSYAGKVRNAERAAAQYRAEAQSAQLRALRYQINPHFLFNTLNSLSTLVMRQHGDEAERMIINLSNFFRTSLTTDPTEDVALIDEIRMQRLYLDIEQIRFPERLRVVVDVPPELESAAVPGMILQPIVENAIKYGVARSGRPVTVTIRARDMHGHLQVTVEDDGAVDLGADPSDGGAQGHGVGLRNVCDRLAARFGSLATCHYGARARGGFRVSLTMPLKTGLSVAA